MTHRFLSTQDVASRLGVSVRTVQRLVVSERLEPLLRAPGDRGAYMFSEEAVEAYELWRDGGEADGSADPSVDGDRGDPLPGLGE
jgi:excisionase family DNA binding protein